MVTVRWALGLLAALCIVLVLVRLRADGLLLLGTGFFGCWLWSCGVFSRTFWVADAATSARLSAVDESIAFAESVASDIDAL
jgi:hypothetical protein